MSITSGWGLTHVVFKRIPAIEEFTDVSSNILLYDKLASRVVVDIISDVDDHFV
jgi:hypothetical protein